MRQLRASSTLISFFSFFILIFHTYTLAQAPPRRVIIDTDPAPTMPWPSSSL